MAENKHDLEQPPVPPVGFERTDVDAWAIGKFGIALVLICVASMAMLLFVFHYFIAREGPPPPKAFSNPANVRRPAGTVLEETPVLDLARERAAEDKILNSYGWVDKDKGIVRIPIDQAIDMLAQKGLPSRTTSPEVSNVSVPSESGLRRLEMRQGTLLALAFATIAMAQPGQPAPAQPSYSMQDSNLKPALPGALIGVGIDQKLDEQVPLYTMLKDEAGRDVPLSTYFSKGKPVLLVPVYYRCPMLCTQILTGVESTLKAVTFDPGKDFEVVAVSIDPKDTPELAAAKKQTYLHRYARPNTANGWHFLTGSEANVRPLMDAIGYHYKYDPKTDQYAHAIGHHGADARWPRVAIFLRRGVCAARRSPGPCGSFTEQNRQPGGRSSAVLLSLRPGHG